MPILKSILNFLIPPTCYACGDKVGNAGGVCTNCWQDLDFIKKPFCKKCGLMLPDLSEDGLECVGCIENPPEFEAARSGLNYSGSASHIISRYKYKDRTENSKILARWMMQAGEDVLKDSEVILPVPLHRLRLVARGYNQSALLAKNIAKNSGKKYWPQILVRTKLKVPQASLNKQQRLGNVEGVFAVKRAMEKKISGKNILVVDDVMTTGATLREIAKILKESGANKVYCLTIARTHN